MKKYFKFFLMAVGIIFAFLSLIVEGLGIVTISSVVICFFLLLIFFQCNYVKWFVNSLLIACSLLSGCYVMALGQDQLRVKVRLHSIKRL